ncbi:DNA-directed RNA polymerase subunit epsilon [Furfurilactobacillus sp. WILCCON 0119]|uniref:DNA-directed RNA polymerase subunit epsilon n=1 Tax=Furfurilactobacillus entadae TaxID=2922307 RepID=UPI0035EC9543
MIFKVYYQDTKIRNPKREDTRSLYVEADNEAAAMSTVSENTAYNVEFIEALEGNALEYEQQSANYKLTEF